MRESARMPWSDKKFSFVQHYLQNTAQAVAVDHGQQPPLVFARDLQHAATFVGQVRAVL